MKMTGRLNRGSETTSRTATAIFTTNSRIIAVHKDTIMDKIRIAVELENGGKIVAKFCFYLMEMP